MFSIFQIARRKAHWSFSPVIYVVLNAWTERAQGSEIPCRYVRVGLVVVARARCSGSLPSHRSSFPITRVSLELSMSILKTVRYPSFFLFCTVHDYTFIDLSNTLIYALVSVIAGFSNLGVFIVVYTTLRRVVAEGANWRKKNVKNFYHWWGSRRCLFDPFWFV